MKFSVLLPTRNRLELLSRAIETVRRQDYDNWEVIVSDNFSEEDVAGYIKSLGDLRIKYFRTDRFVPVTDNWNNAIDKSDGDYVIMLGDDDCLMKGYFSTLSRLIEKFDAPDFIYTSAFLYAYPGVMPGVPDGFLRTYNNREVFQSAKEPFWLERSKAIEFANDSLNFKVTFDYNMQFSLVSRKLIEKMKRYGSFYQSPYPDYYASNAMMLKAERILVVPQPLVTIGISPKSFGCYYFNDAESDGNEFLNNIPDRNMVSRLHEVSLPGVAMNTSWLISMETLAVNFSGELDLKANYVRYRLIQILAVYDGFLTGRNVGKVYRQLMKKMHFSEWLRYGFMLLVIKRIAPKRYHAFLEVSRSHSEVHMPDLDGKFQTILDVFEQIDPESYSEKVASHRMGDPLKELCVAHLVRAQNGIEPFKSFLESYRANPAGIEHDLLIVFKGFTRPQDTAEYRELLAPFRHATFDVSDKGFDITAYFSVAKRYSKQYRYFCFLNSYSVILARDWLKKLHENICKPDVGLAGATGSWQSHGPQSISWWEVLDVAQQHYRVHIQKPFRTRVILAGIGARNYCRLVNTWNFRLLPVYFDPYPNYHLRTNAFIISAQMMQSLKSPRLREKIDAYAFESGSAGLTKQILQKGKKVIVVGRDGIGYEKESWCESKTFRQSEQENLLVEDNQTRDYQLGTPERRDYLTDITWGSNSRVSTEKIDQ